MPEILCIGLAQPDVIIGLAQPDVYISSCGFVSLFVGWLVQLVSMLVC